MTEKKKGMPALPGFKKKQKLSEEERLQQTREKSAQQWVPVADIDNGMMIRKDGVLVKYIRLEPINLSLLTEKEKERRMEMLAEELNGEREAFSIFSIGRPVDLSGYLNWLQGKAKDEDNLGRRKLLKRFISHGSQVASSGEVIERRFYVILTRANNSKKAYEELLERTRDFSSKLQSAAVANKVCNDDEIFDLLALFGNPNQAAIETNIIEHDLPTLLYS